MEKRCKCCERRFIPHPAVRHQEYCRDPECQKARKRKWQKEKLASDSDYRANQAEAQRQWCSRQPAYWRQDREKNPAYTETNRMGQKERNRRRRSGGEVAKMDELKGEPLIKSGCYRLVPLYNPGIAKMDELIVELGVISRGYVVRAERL